MGGGQKRGRTQRRHFKQSKDNVWKHNNNPKKTRPDDEANNGDPNSNPNPNPNTKWDPFISQNPGFEEYYKEQGIVPEEEWEEFMCLLRKPLPAAFRINSSGQFSHDIRLQLENDFMKSLEAEANNENESEAIRPLPWYPDNLAWHLNFSRMQLRKNQTLERFHEFLKQENEVGNITRQEAVSMVPPLFLDVLPDHHVLDMCAAPGSKTFQLLEIIHQSKEPGLLPDGLVIANDVDVQRCNLLIHQTKRMCSANLIVTNHEAQHFPSCSLTKGCIEISNIGQQELGKSVSVLQFDRVLCDVPCSGDGTLRKAPDIWRKWNAGMGNGIHRLQVEIAMRGLALLKVGGRMVYSTCSMNPVENEAVVAEVLRRSKGSVELLDVSNELPELVRRQGLRTWKERQGSKDGSSPCLFRLSSEGLPLLLPYITKQILCASLADFRHLLQYRTIKFADFVDAKFGEMASELMLGCCVVVLGEVSGKQSPDTIQVDASTIAIVCWKGRTNLCIMVSQLDGQELLERLSMRFGCEKSATRNEEVNGNLVTGGAENPEDQEPGEPNADGEQLGKSEAATHQAATS